MHGTVSLSSPGKRNHIIAVGGAWAAGTNPCAPNLGVYPAGQGHRTVLVDLDFGSGSANLHFYQGVWAQAYNLNDYLG